MSPGSLALVLAAAFSGAALYVNLVEQPARLALEDQAMLNEWTPRRAIGALIIVLSWPYTFFAMAPLNDQILTLAPRDIGAARILVRQWGLLEYGQTGIGVVACAVFLWAL